MPETPVDDFHIAIVGKFSAFASIRYRQLASTLGAGIAGLALAMGLKKKGIPFTLYEEAKEYSTVG